jgi:hypothetical protein
MVADKQLFENKDRGWIGVVIMGPDGKPTGVPLAPGQTVRMNEIEMRLTANAPMRPEDNPFVPQTRIVTDVETGVMSEETVTPLVAIKDTRYVPQNERPIPGVYAPPPADPLAPVLTNTAASTAPVPPPAVLPPAPVPQPSPRAAAAARAATGTPIGGQPLTPGGQNRTQPTYDDADPVAEDPFKEQPMNSSPEETAAAVDPAIGEETGAAKQPTGAQPVGHYQAQEEVGTPTAPEQPAPWNPEGER